MTSHYDDNDGYEEKDDMLTSTYSDRDRATYGIADDIQGELGMSAIGARLRTPREKAILRMLVIAKSKPFDSLVKSIRTAAQSLFIRVRPLEVYNPHLLFTAAVYVVTNKKKLTANSFSSFMSEYPPEDENSEKATLNETVVLRYIRKLQSL